MADNPIKTQTDTSRQLSASPIDFAKLPTYAPIDSIWLSGSLHFHNKDNHAPPKPDKDGKNSNRYAFGEFISALMPLTHIATNIIAGKAISVARLEGNWRSEQHFISSQLMGVDLDESPTINDLLNEPLTEYGAFLIYATSSSTPEKPKSRVLFVLDQPITDRQQYRRLVLRLIHYYKRFGAQADVKCKDPTRIFFGHETDEIESRLDRVLPIALLEELPPSPTERILTGTAAPALVPNMKVVTLQPSVKNLLSKTRDFMVNGAKIVEGQRNNRLFEAACDIAANNFRIDDARRMLYSSAIGSGLSEEETESTIQSAYSQPRNPVRPSESQTQPDDWLLLTFEELQNLPPTKWLVPEVIPEAGLVMIYGQPGHAKSFLAQHYALTVAQNRSVVYVAAEGAGGLPARMNAWQRHNNKSAGNIRVLRRDVPMLNMQSVTSFVEAIRPYKPELVILDTLARCTAGADENSVKDMGTFISACALIQQIGAAVLVVHHSNKEGSNYRGSSVLHAACDMMFKSTKSGSRIAFVCEKAKEVEAPPSKDFSLHKIEGTDSAALTYLGVTAQKADFGDLDDYAMLRFIYDNGGQATPTEIAVALWGDKNMREKARQHLVKLKAKDQPLVEQPTSGHPYQLTTEGKEAVESWINPLIEDDEHSK